MTPEDAANAFKCWEWQERQAKFIVNSCRVYEFWGYDWRIPLWDNEMMDFWAKVPLGLRVEKRLYDGFLEKMLFKKFQLYDFEVKKKKYEFSKFVDPRYGRYHIRDFVHCGVFYQKKFGLSLNSLRYINMNTLGGYISTFDIRERI